MPGTPTLVQTGKDQYCFIGAADGSTPVSCGIVKSGSREAEIENIEMHGIGSSDAQEQRPGLVVPSGSIDFFVRTTSKTLLQKANLTADALPEFSIDCGTITAGKVHKYCKNSSVKVSAAFKGPFMGSFGWKGVQIAAGTPQADQAPGAGITYMWHEGAISVIGQKVREFVFTGNSDPEPEGGIGVSPRTDAKQREADAIVEGERKATLEVKLFAPTSIDYVADALAELATVAITGTNGSDILTLTLTGLMITKEAMAMASGKGAILYTVPFNVRSFAIT